MSTCSSKFADRLPLIQLRCARGRGGGGTIGQYVPDGRGPRRGETVFAVRDGAGSLIVQSEHSLMTDKLMTVETAWRCM